MYFHEYPPPHLLPVTLGLHRRKYGTCYEILVRSAMLLYFYSINTEVVLLLQQLEIISGNAALAIQQIYVCGHSFDFNTVVPGQFQLAGEVADVGVTD